MIGQPFKVNGIGEVEQNPGFAGAGAATENLKILFFDERIQAVDQESTQRFVPPLTNG